MKKTVLLLSSFFLITIVVYSCSVKENDSDKKVLVVGGKFTTEQDILVEIAAQLIERHTNYSVIRKTKMGNTAHIFSKLSKNEIDLYCEYLGTTYLEVLGRNPGVSLQDMEAYVKEQLLAQYRVRMLPSLGFANQYVLVMDKEKAETKKIFSLSDLVFRQKQTGGLVFGFDPTFALGPERSLFAETYTLELFKKYFVMQHELLYSSLRKKKLDVVAAYSTDASLISNPVLILQDDLNVFPSYQASFLIREEIASSDPQLIEILEELESIITHDEMQTMNYQVEKKHLEAYKVARNFLISKKII